MGLLSQRAVATYGGRDLLHGGALRKNGETCLASARNRAVHTHGGLQSLLRPRIRRDYPLNLSISVSGGKETNKDSLSNGE